MVLNVVTNDTTLSRIVWTPRDDGKVRQLWELSRDHGETWNVIYDGLYTRRKGGGEGTSRSSQS